MTPRLPPAIGDGSIATPRIGTRPFVKRGDLPDTVIPSLLRSRGSGNRLPSPPPQTFTEVDFWGAPMRACAQVSRSAGRRWKFQPAFRYIGPPPTTAEFGQPPWRAREAPNIPHVAGSLDPAEVIPFRLISDLDWRESPS